VVIVIREGSVIVSRIRAATVITVIIEIVLPPHPARIGEAAMAKGVK
jgi:hypothetical protein